MDIGIYVALGLLAVYLLFVYWVIRTGKLEKWNLSLMLGVVLMVRTERGRGLLTAIARPRRFWNVVGDLGIVLTLGGMLVITFFFLWSVWFVLQPGSGVPALGASEILVIPGVNPFVPLWYGLAALAFTLVVHEAGHGVLARANGMRVKSIGLLIAVVPVGAFVEPDDLDLKVASRRARLRVFGAGPAVNLGFAALALAAFALLVGAATPTPGAHVAQLVQDAPSMKAGLAVGDTIVLADAQPVRDWTAFQGVLNRSTPGQELHLTLADGGVRTATLASYWAQLSSRDKDNVTAGTPAGMTTCRARLEPDPATGDECATRLQAQAYIGIVPLLPQHTAFLSDPFVGGGRGLLNMMSLPVAEVRGNAPYLSTYLPAFHDAPFEPALFWGLVSLAFWIFWINLMVGLTNILPMLPLDGGHIFRDAVGGVVQRLRPGLAAETRERMVGRFATGMSLLILGAFLLQILGPHLVQSFV
ncbi:MAG: hypothetical protein QOD77_759 [Thermoplasmata archaeon]|nr:hypothetical protein [Thermoplasmata archaeon]